MTRILIVDNEPDAVRMLARMLELDGFEAIGAQSGQEAVEWLAKNQADAVILDWMLPDVDGLELTRRLRAMPALAKMPIVITTAEDEPDVKKRFHQAGASAFLGKPVDTDALAALLRRLTGSG